MAAFRAGTTRVLVATDVAARGIDVPGVTHVINFSLGCPSRARRHRQPPSGPSSVWPSPSVAGYVHRIGRCGRAGRVGIAVTLLVDTDRRLAPELVTLLRRSGQPVPPELTDWARRAPVQGPVELDDDAAAEAEARAENRERQLERERQKRQGGRRKGGRA